MDALLLIVGLAGLVGFIWLLVVAFKTHVLWGLACLFLPFATVVFAILNWRQAAKPFLLHTASSVLIFVLAWSYIASFIGTLDPEAMQLQAENMQNVQQQILLRVQRGEMSEADAQREMRLLMQAALTGEPYRPAFMQEAGEGAALRIERDGSADLDEAAIDAKIAAAIAEEDARLAALAAPKPQRVQVYVPKDPGGAAADIGKPVKLITRNGLERSGDLIEVTEDGSLVVEQRIRGGQVVYTVASDVLGDYKVLEWVER